MNNQAFKIKKIELAVKGLFTLLFGTAAVVAAFGFLAMTSSPAVAETPTNTFLPASENSGKYMMQYHSVLGADDKVTWYYLVWDTETGRSKAYYANGTSGVQASHSDYNLPSSPL